VLSIAIKAAKKLFRKSRSGRFPPESFLAAAFGVLCAATGRFPRWVSHMTPIPATAGKARRQPVAVKEKADPVPSGPASE
jgi:hypothetical protein